MNNYKQVNVICLSKIKENGQIGQRTCLLYKFRLNIEKMEPVKTAQNNKIVNIAGSV